ncbi:MerR family transcriptional regulator [Candidatus Omnitrophota bacterium]
MKKRFYIQDLEKIVGVKRKTYFYWEKKGKVPRAKREKMSGYRYWTLKDLRRLRKLVTS